MVRTRKDCALVLLLVCALKQLCIAEIPVKQSAGSFGQLKSGFGLGKAKFKLATQIWEGINYIIDKTSDVPESDGPLYKPSDSSIQRDVTDGLRYLSAKTDDLKIDMLNTQNGIVDEVLEQVPAIIQLNQRFAKIFVSTTHINEKYKKFLNYYQRPDKYDKSIIKTFANTALNGKNGVKSLLEKIHSLLVLGDHSTFSAIQLLNDNMKVYLILYHTLVISFCYKSISIKPKCC